MLNASKVMSHTLVLTQFLLSYLTSVLTKKSRAPVAQLVEHRVVMWEVVSLTLAGPTLRVLK